MTEDKRPPHRDWHGTHHNWLYRPQAFRWNGSDIVGINFAPLAGDMRAWLHQHGQLSLEVEKKEPGTGGYYNPYTSWGISLSLLLGSAVNACHEFTVSKNQSADPIETEIERIRLYNELVMYIARFCEVVIKQLLFCSGISESHYEKSALGALLESPCRACKKENGKKPHLISLLGSLAHPFGLCLEFDNCAFDHMDFANKLRNKNSSHAQVKLLNVITPDNSRSLLLAEFDEVLGGFRHMLTHYEKLEYRMREDLAIKGAQIMALKADGLPTEECHFRLAPNEPFVFNRGAEDSNSLGPA